MSYFKKIAVFASGSGTNTLNLVNYFEHHDRIKIEVIFVNRPNAGVVYKMKDVNMPVFLFNKEMFYENSSVTDELKSRHIDYIVLAGFLWLVPKNIIELYNDRIINIHPALLPFYGGKGMYGNKVHETVISNKKNISGISIHLVNEEYDKGKILFQATCPVFENDTAESLAKRIHQLEYLHYPKVIEAWILSF
jgi:phosphoribosylglycinamide formyltransferase-1